MANSSDTRRGHCPDCNRNQICNVVGHKHTSWDSEDRDMWATDDYYILECRGCEAVFFQHSSFFSEYEAPTVQHWPPEQTRAEPQWLSVTNFRKASPVYRRMKDVYGALNAGLSVPAAGAMRTAFDVVATHMGVDPKLPFAGKLNDLVARGELSVKDRDTLNVLVEAGSASLHRGWEPNSDDLQTLAHILESFVERHFIVSAGANKLSQSVPKKTKP